MEIDGSMGWSDWIGIALFFIAISFAFWVGREYQKGKERDEW